MTTYDIDKIEEWIKINKRCEWLNSKLNTVGQQFKIWGHVNEWCQNIEFMKTINK